MGALITVLPYMKTSQWTGRTNSVRWAPQRMRLGIGRLWQQLNRGFALLYRAVDDPGALIGFQGIQLLRGNAQGAGKPIQGLGGVAIIVEGGLDRRATLFHRLVRLGVFQLAHSHSQSTWSGEGFDLVKNNASLLQTAADTLGKCIRQGFEGLGRELLGAQLDQKILSSHDYAFPFLAFLPFLPLPAFSSAARTSLRSASGASGKPRALRLSK